MPLTGGLSGDGATDGGVSEADGAGEDGSGEGTGPGRQAARNKLRHLAPTRETLVIMAQGSCGGELAAIRNRKGQPARRDRGGLLRNVVCGNFAVASLQSLKLYVPDRFPGEDDSGGPLCQLWSHQRPGFTPQLLRSLRLAHEAGGLDHRVEPTRQQARAVLRSPHIARQ